MNGTVNTSAVVPVDRQGRIDVDVTCLHCQYNLRAQPPAGHCPECGHPIPESLSSDHAVMMPPFWLGQVWRGAVCLAIAWLTIPLCGIGMIIGLIGAFAICGDPPLSQLRVRGLRQFTIGSMLGAGMMLFGSLLARDTVLYLLPLAGLALSLSLAVIGLHLFAHRIALAARQPSLGWPSIALACATPLLPLLFLIAMIAHDTIAYRSPLRDVVDAVWMAMYLTFVGYGLCQMIFWLIFARCLKRIHDNALAVAQQRSVAGP